MFGKDNNVIITPEVIAGIEWIAAVHISAAPRLLFMLEPSKAESKHKVLQGPEPLGCMVCYLGHGQRLGDPAGRPWVLHTLQMARTPVDFRGPLAVSRISPCSWKGELLKPHVR